MDTSDIETLADLMREKGLTRVHLKEKDGREIHLEMGGVAAQPSHAAPAAPLPAAVPPQGAAEGKSISSPLVGTFYSSPSPEDPPFVKVGDAVTEETVVCIVEAMKVMNEVKAGISGTVKEMLIENGHPVEFGTKLFRVE